MIHQPCSPRIYPFNNKFIQITNFGISSKGMLLMHLLSTSYKRAALENFCSLQF